MQKVGERVPSEHELRVQRSLQRLNVPDWYKNSPAARDGFRLKRHSDASQHGGWRALGSKTTSLSSLSSSSNRQPTTGKTPLPCFRFYLLFSVSFFLFFQFCSFSSKRRYYKSKIILSDRKCAWNATPNRRWKGIWDKRQWKKYDRMTIRFDDATILFWKVKKKKKEKNHWEPLRNFYSKFVLFLFE